MEALKEFPEEMRQWRDEHGCWSVHEHFVHVTDSEVNSYVRCRRLIAEQGGTILAYDENKWASLLDYHSQSIDDALELFKWLRRQSYKLIKTLPEPVWSHTAIHSEDGEMSLDDWLEHVQQARLGAHRVHAREPGGVEGGWEEVRLDAHRRDDTMLNGRD